MSRIRSLHPGFFTDERLVTTSLEARLLFLGLGIEADDKGIFEWKPVTLKMRIFPADHVDVAARLDELVEAEAIMAYEVQGRKYGAIRNFRRFQRPKLPNDVHPMPPHFGSYVGLTQPTSEVEPREVHTLLPSPPLLAEVEPREVGPVPKKGEKSFQMEDVKGGDKKEEKNIPPARAKNVPKNDVNGFRTELSTILDHERIDGLVQVRRNKRGALTPYAARLLKAKIATCGIQPDQAADTMILRGWISIEQSWLTNRANGPPHKPSNGLAELADEALQHIKQLREQDHEPANQDRYRRDVEFLPPDRRKL